MEEIILLVLTVFSILILTSFYKLFEKKGLYYTFILLNVLSLVLSFKIGYIFKTNINLGIIPIIATFTTIYIYLIKYGSKDSKHLLILTIMSSVITAISLIIMNYCIPAITETVSISMQGTFETNYKIFIVYPIVMTISNFIIIKLYDIISKIQNNIILTVVLEYIMTSLIFTILAYILFYINILSIKDSLYIGVSTYILGLILTIAHSIFLYFYTKKKVKK
jgi:uncharacterized PurR-regulated membrane protein YhhQ (DUF165 family)